MSRIRVTSEVGPLRAVLVHAPGQELLAVTPDTQVQYLYDDIIDIPFAQREHARMRDVLQCFADVFEVTDLLRDVLDIPEARDFLIARTRDVVPSPALSVLLSDGASEDVARILVEGYEDRSGPIADCVNLGGYSLPPVPNLFFTRDIGIVLGDHVVIGSMRHHARWSEELLIKTLFQFHPSLANAGFLYDGSLERRTDFSIEGGDVHPLREDLVLVGLSSRTSAAALDHLCELLFEANDVRDVIVVVMPGETFAIHLDMIFTQVDRELVVVYPPHFFGPGRLAVLHRRKGDAGVTEAHDLFAALRSVAFPVEPIACGGRRRAVQDREQWGSGCNLVAVRPGVALAYKRNSGTLEELEKAGFAILDAGEFVSSGGTLEPDRRAIITFEGAELVRGGGGPRCMTMPLCRDAL
jgi:arginine deiminase